MYFVVLFKFVKKRLVDIDKALFFCFFACGKLCTNYRFHHLC